MTDGSGPALAAIVATVGRRAELEACLASLAAARPAFAQAIVVDQSADTALEPVARAHGATWLHLERRGLSLARNAGIARITAGWACFPDDDCTVSADLVARLGDAIARHPDAGWIAGRVVAPTGRALAVGMDARERPLVTVRDVLRTLMSAALFVRRDVFERIGGFDEALGVGAKWPSGEESDFALRALGAGIAGAYAPELTVFHPEPFAVRDAGEQAARAFAYGRGWGALFAKHASGVLGAQVRDAHRHYLGRALGGAAAAAATGRLALAQRYVASWRGRRAGWSEYRSVAGGRA